MTYQKIRWTLAAGALLLMLLLLKFVPWEALVTLLFLLGIMLSPIISQLLQILKAHFQPIPHYQPSPEQPLKSTYQQGYHAQRNDQPKQDPPGAWDQPPQVATPEQAPPPMQL